MNPIRSEQKGNTMHRFTSAHFSRNRHEAVVDKITRREKWQLGHMSGEPLDVIKVQTENGMLSDYLVRDLFGAQYIIYSYETPIAWLTSEQWWVVPNVKYSATTTRHQRVIKSMVVDYEDKAVAE